MKKICVVGVGYVGLITAAGFADLGNNVVGLDIEKFPRVFESHEVIGTVPFEFNQGRLTFHVGKPGAGRFSITWAPAE